MVPSSVSQPGPRARSSWWPRLRPLLLLTLALLPAGTARVGAPAPGPPPAFVVFSELPPSGQFFGRNDQGFARVPVSGYVLRLGVEREIRLDLYQDGLLFDSRTRPLVFSGFVAPFSFRQPLPARCHDYRLVVTVVSDATAETVVAVRDGLLSGEVLLIQGQSNAQAADGHGEGLANQSQRPWVRSFGSNSLDPASVAADRNWRMAEGQRGSGPAAVGAWGLRLGQLLADRQGVPIAILNGSRGGTRIDEHLRAPLDPEDLDTLYGRLLYRADRGGVRQAVTAILWLQGEADRLTSGADYADRFDQLYRAWEEDFPALEKVYVVQIRYGCLPSNLEVHEALRLAASDHPKVELMATTAVRGHDGCHYWYSGYREIGDLVERLVAHDLFGVPAIPGMRPPNVRLARYTSPQQDELRLEFHSPAAAPVFETGAEWDFLLDGGATVVSGRADGGTLLLQVSPPGAATRISYRSRPGNGPRVMTGLGVGILGFHELPIRP